MTNQQYEDLTQRKLAYLGRLFESAGAGPAFIRQFEERPYMLPKCIEAVQAILDEDRYHEPEPIKVKTGFGWHRFMSANEDFGLDVKVLDVKKDESYRLAINIIPSDNPAEAKSLEAIVTRDRWAGLAFGVELRQHKWDEFWVRYPRQHPLYFAESVQSAQQ